MDQQYFLKDAWGGAHPIVGELVIGRVENCHLRLADSAVSRIHAILWVSGGYLYIRDENTSNGTYVNGSRIPPRSPIQLTHGCQLQLGQTFFTVLVNSPAQPASARRPPQKSRLAFYLAGALLLVCVGLIGVGGLFMLLRGDLPQAVGGISQEPMASGVTILATSQPPAAFSPQQIADQHTDLTGAVGSLNAAELAFIEHARAAGPDPAILDDDLRQVAAQAIQVALLAEPQGLNAAMQGISNVDQYNSIARLGYALVYVAQELRLGLQTGQFSSAQAADTIAQYGRRLWRPNETGVDNPFAAYLADAGGAGQLLNSAGAGEFRAQLGDGRQVESWLASTTKLETITLQVPALGPGPANPFDATLLQSLTQASAQADANLARQVAASKLGWLSGVSIPPGGNTAYSLDFSLYEFMAIADAGLFMDGLIPIFLDGTATALVSKDGEEDPFTMNVFALAGEDPPVLQESEPVRAVPPVVSLAISSVKIKNRTKTDHGELVVLEVQLTWQTSFTNAQLNLGCMGGIAADVSGQSGTRMVDAAGFVSPANEVSVHCRALRPADFVTSLADAYMAVSVAAGSGSEPPASTETMTPTATETLQPTPTLDQTAQALETEVSQQKTAEFIATVTAAAAQTQAAVQAGSFTMSGTYGLGQPDEACSPGLYTSGTLQIAVDLAAGTAGGSLQGGGSLSRNGLTCNDVTYDQVCTRTYTGTFNGSVVPASGTLAMSGSISGSQSCTFSNCKQNGVPFACSPESTNFSVPLTLTGSVFPASGSGKGTLTTCPGCQGDWSAAK